jgi:hypothetical protein
MAVKSSDDRLYNYKLKHDSVVIKKQADQRRDRLRAKQETAQTELVNIEERTKVILGTFAVPTWTYPAYLNFVREAWKKSKKFHDQTLAKETIGGIRGEIRDDHLLRSDVKARRGYAASDQIRETLSLRSGRLSAGCQRPVAERFLHSAERALSLSNGLRSE